MKVRIGDKVWDKEAIHALLDKNDEAVGRALIVVYNNQTADEKVAAATRHENGKGFSGRDAEWLTDISKKWLVWRRWASRRQCDAVRKAVKRYHRQILQHMLESTPGAVLDTTRASRKVVESRLEDDPATASCDPTRRCCAAAVLSKH